MAEAVKDKRDEHPAGKAGFEQKAFEALERDFQEVLQELQGDRSLDRFRVEYEKLHRALKKSHESEKRLIKKCRELNTEILANAGKVQNALKLNEEDQNTIIALKKEIDKAWKMVDASQEKEAKAKDNITELKNEIANLSKLVEQGADLTIGQDSAVKDLEREKDRLAKERDAQVQQIVQLRNEIVEMDERSRVSEAEKATLQHDLLTLKEQVAVKKAESDREMKKKERMEKEMKELKIALDARQNDIRQKQLTVAQGQEQVTKLEFMLREQKQSAEKAQKELDIVTQQVAKLTTELEDQILNNTTLLAENSQRQVELKLKDDEIETVKAEVFRVNKLRDAAVVKMKALEKTKDEIEQEREELRAEIVSLEKDVEAQKKLVEQEHRRQEELCRERDVLNKMKTQAEVSTQKQADLVKINEATKNNLELEINMYKYAAQKQDKQIAKLEKERQRYGAEASQAAAKYMQALDEVRAREISIVDLQKKVIEGENKLKQQQTAYEAVRSERNLYSKTLLEVQDEIQELKRKFKIMTHHIENLKEEINSKDLALIKEHYDHTKVEKEKENLKVELSKANVNIKEVETQIAEQQAQIENLNHIINEADDETQRQKKELDIIKHERDLLGAQLIRRNEELALLYEKIRIQQSTLNKGQIQYRDRLNEVRILKIKMTDLKREHCILSGSVKNLDVLKKEVHNLGRELLQERMKVKALSEELETPLNVHRWRKLEGTDPVAFEMILKIQTLQKRLILKTEEVVEKDLLIQEKEKLYIELRSILARQPGPELQEQLGMYAKNLREKTRQIKAMASELSMYQTQVNEYKFEIERLNGEVDATKKKYFEFKRKELAEKERKKASQAANTIDPIQHPKVLGGGYNMTAPLPSAAV